MNRAPALTEPQRKIMHDLLARQEASRRAMSAALGGALDAIESLDWPLGAPLANVTVDEMLSSLGRMMPHSVPAAVYNAARAAALEAIDAKAGELERAA